MYWPELSAWEVDLKKEWTKLQSRWTRATYPTGYTNYSFLPDSMIGPYAQTDAFIALGLFTILKPEMDEWYGNLYERELEVMNCIIDVEFRGLAWDIAKAKREIKKLSSYMDEARDVCETFDKPDACVAYWKTVYDTMLLLGAKPKDFLVKGKRTTDAEKIKEIASTGSDNMKRYVENVLLYRAYTKTVNTYLNPLTEIAEVNNGTVYTSINPADTRTGRMASREPNLQNIPTLTPRRGRTSGGENPVRSCFCCRKDFTNYFFDYANMEMAAFGAYTNSNLILETYSNGGDVHGVMAEKLYGKDYTPEERNRTKDTNFGVIYGMGPRGMAKARGVSESEAKDFLKMYLRTFPEIRAFQDKCKYLLQRDGFVQDWFGKMYHIPWGDSYKAVNALIQGVCASGFKVGLLNTVDMLSAWQDVNVILPIHDEVMIEVPNHYKEKQLIEEVSSNMVNIPEFLDRGLTLRVDVKKSTTNWAEKKEVTL
jgi:DNA polymerase-1